MLELPRKIVLASSSQYRRKVLEKLNFPFDTFSPEVDESARDNETVSDLVTRLSKLKAEAVAEKFPDALIIGSDQVAECDGRILTKPGGFDRAVEQLSWSANKKAVFHTGLCVLDSASGEHSVELETFNVMFRDLSRQEIENYLRIDEPYDSSGSFKSEGFGIVLFDRLEGRDPNTLVGLPLILLLELLKRHGVKLV